MDELGKSIPAGEVLVDAEQGNSPKIVNEHCLNCGTKLLDTFCHHCGQKDIPQRQTLGELWTNFISSFWSFEGKFFQTTKYILTKPGFLAVEYTEGRRERYFHPARMYVFLSFVFFLLFFSLPDPDDKNEKPTRRAKDSVARATVPFDSTSQFSQLMDSVTRNAELDSADRAEIEGAKKAFDSAAKKKKKGMNFSGADFETKQAYDSHQLTLPETKRDNWFERKMNYQAIEINDTYQGDDEKFEEDFKNSFLENFSKVLFWLLPFFALVLKLLYIRRGYFFSEHLVFSIYYYNFFYLAGSIKMLVEQITWLDWLGTCIGFWIFFYLLFAMKRMYKQGWGKTTVKFTVFASVFTILAGVAIAILAISLLLSY